MTDRPRRALLFMPGDDLHKIEKGAAQQVDLLIMDLEDGVVRAHKAQARETVARALQSVDFGASERLIRVNAITGGGQYVQDIRATAPFRPDGYVLPKVDSAAQVLAVSRLLGSIESWHGWPLNSLCLLAIIETARGIVNLREIADSDTRLEALIFGAEDLAGDIGAQRTPDGWEVFYARSAVVVHARAFSLQAIDLPYVHLENLPGLEADAEQARIMGYDGKLAIYPRQVEVIQQGFTPSMEEVATAQRLITAYEAHQAAGQGVFVMEGQMIDAPMLRTAQRVLERAGMVQDPAGSVENVEP